RHSGPPPGAWFRDAITVEDVLASKPIASPLKLLDCCPVSDGGVAFVVAREPSSASHVRIRGAGQAHTHQYVTGAPSLTEFGAKASVERARERAGIALSDVRYAAIYDSFTITLTILLEEIGLAPRGQAGKMTRAGYFDRDGEVPLNTHGGLLSYGH